MGEEQTGGRATDSSRVDRLPATEIHDLLRNERRRLALEHLFETDAPVTISELAEAVAAAEAGEDPPPDDTKQSVYVSLYQNHLPKLESVGIVDRDEDDRLALTDRADRVETYLCVDDRPALVPQFAGLYVVVAGFGLATTGLAAADVVPTNVLPAAAWAACGFLGVGALAAAQYGLYRRATPGA